MCRLCMCLQRGSDRKKGGGEGLDTASLKLGAEPKATKVALDPASLSPVETSSGIEHMRTVVLFKGNHFPLARSLNGYKMRSLSCHRRKCQKNLNENRKDSFPPFSKTTAEPYVACV